MGACEQLKFKFDEFDPLEPRSLPSAGWPFFTINFKGDDSRMHQKPFRAARLGPVLTDISAGRLTKR